MNLSDAPAQLVEAWATGDATKTNPIPVPSQEGITPGAASYTDGFPPLCATPVASGGIPPSKADMNGILYGMSAVDVWMCAGGGFPYNSAFQTAIGGYPKGARVLMASGNGYWVSTVDNNVTDPDTGGAGWASADDNAMTALTGDVTAAGPGSAAATLAASGVTAGSYIGADITVDAKGRVTAASNGFTNGTSGGISWRKGPDGFIQQWANGVSLGGGDYTVTFLGTPAFTGTPNVQVTCVYPSGDTGFLSTNSESTSGFVIHQNNITGMSANWRADGY